jgi:hypothetical protein
MTTNFLFVAFVWLSGLLATPPLVAVSVLPGGGVDSPAPLKQSVVAQFPDARVVVSKSGREVVFLSGIRGPTQGSTVRERAEGFLAKHGHLTGAANLRYAGQTKSTRGASVRFEQLHEGFPVFDRQVVVRIDVDGFVTSFTNDARTIVNASSARIDEIQATALALKAIGEKAEPETRATQGWTITGGHGVAVFEIECMRLPLAEHLVIRIDAHEGRLLSIRNRVLH